MLKNFFLIVTIALGGREREITEIKKKANRATQRGKEKEQNGIERRMDRERNRQIRVQRREARE